MNSLEQTSQDQDKLSKLLKSYKQVLLQVFYMLQESKTKAHEKDSLHGSTVNIMIYLKIAKVDEN